MIVKSTGSCAVPQEATALTIDDCENVTVIEDALSGLKELQSVTFNNIKELSIERKAFRWKGHGLSVNMTNVTVIPDVPNFAFGGSIVSVVFDRCYVGMIRAFAFANIESAQKISFSGCNVANVESQAFKKFSVSKFLVLNSQFTVIPSRFLFEVDVENLFKVQGTFFDVIRTAAFVVNSPKVTIVTDSRVNLLHSEGFKIRTNGDVVIQHNKFSSIEGEAFRGLFVERYIIQHAGKPKFRFINNTITNYGKKSLLYNKTSFDGHFSRVMMDEICTCDGLITWRDMIQDGRPSADKSIEDEVEPFWCRVEDTEASLEHVPGREFYRTRCTLLNKSIFFFVVIIVATSISLVLIITFIVCFFRRRKRWSLVPTSAQDGQKEVQLKAKGDTKVAGSKAIIVPDGRTYRETEFHVIVEKAEPLDVGYVPCKVVRDRSRSQISSK